MRDRDTILKPLLQLAGKGDFELDSAIPTSYIVRTCWDYGTASVRRLLRGSGLGSTAGHRFIDHGVALRCEGKIRLVSEVRLRDRLNIDALSYGGVGDCVLLGSKTRIECTGSLASIGKEPTIGNNSTFGVGFCFGVVGGIELVHDMIAGQPVHFHSEDHNFVDANIFVRKQGVMHRGIRIGDNVWIGNRMAFLDGVIVGHGCVMVTAGKHPLNFGYRRDARTNSQGPLTLPSFGRSCKWVTVGL